MPRSISNVGESVSITPEYDLATSESEERKI